MKQKQIAIKLDQNIIKVLKQYAKIKGYRFSFFIRNIIIKAVEEINKEGF